MKDRELLKEDKVFDEILEELRTIITERSIEKRESFYHAVLVQMDKTLYKLFLVDRRAPSESAIFGSVELDKPILLLEKQFSGNHKQLLSNITEELIKAYEKAV
jgi:hypothetical protein